MSESADDMDQQLISEVAAVAAALFSPASVEDTLQRVVELAVSSVDDCALAGILVSADQAVDTRAASDPAVIDLDQLQLRNREGPCLEALAGAGPVYSGDLGTDRRYPGFGPAAQAAGIRSALAYRLLVDGADGALNLYARLPNAFGSHDRARAAILAALAGTALNAAVNRREAQARSDNLEQALLSREVIGQAQGILIERERITPEQAFDILRRASQHLNEKLRDIAQHLVDTGEDPDTGPHR